MDSDIREILDLSDQMKECFKRLEARRTLNQAQEKTVTDSAKQFRWLRFTYLSELRAEFDPEYAKWLKDMSDKLRNNNQ